jgi:hypothetical protein
MINSVQAVHQNGIFTETFGFELARAWQCTENDSGGSETTAVIYGSDFQQVHSTRDARSITRLIGYRYASRRYRKTQGDIFFLEKEEPIFVFLIPQDSHMSSVNVDVIA